jgi:deoxycytidine triphosphate deaminase
MPVLGLEDLKVLQGKLLVIFPAKDSCFTPLGYDLRIGKHILLCLVQRDENETPAVGENGDLIFPAYSTSLVITRERVWLSKYVMATIQSRGSLAARGLFLNTTTVDPNWDGKMIMRIFNSSPREESLPRDEPFATMVVHTLRRPTPSFPATDPKRVVSRLVDLYGASVGSRLYVDANSNESQRERNEGDRLIDQGKFYCRLPLPVRWGWEWTALLSRIKRVRNEAIRVAVLAAVSAGAPYAVNWMMDGGLFDATQIWSIYIPLGVTLFAALYATKFFRVRGEKSPE